MNFRKYAGIILNILVPLLTVYLVRCAGTGDLWHLCAVFLGVPGNDGVWAGTARNLCVDPGGGRSGLRADRGTFEVSSCRHGDDDRFRAGECGLIYR